MMVCTISEYNTLKKRLEELKAGAARLREALANIMEYIGCLHGPCSACSACDDNRQDECTTPDGITKSLLVAGYKALATNAGKEVLEELEKYHSYIFKPGQSEILSWGQTFYTQKHIEELNLEELVRLRKVEQAHDSTVERMRERDIRVGDLGDENQKLREQVEELKGQTEHITNEENWAKSIGKEMIEDLQTQLAEAQEQVKELESATTNVMKATVDEVEKVVVLEKRVGKLESEQPLAFIKGLNRLHERACIYYERKRFKKEVKSLIRVQNICGKEYLEEMDDLQAKLAEAVNYGNDADNQVKEVVDSLSEAQERVGGLEQKIINCLWPGKGKTIILNQLGETLEQRWQWKIDKIKKLEEQVEELEEYRAYSKTLQDQLAESLERIKVKDEALKKIEGISFEINQHAAKGYRWGSMNRVHDIANKALDPPEPPEESCSCTPGGTFSEAMEKDIFESIIDNVKKSGTTTITEFTLLDTIIKSLVRCANQLRWYEKRTGVCMAEDIAILNGMYDRISGMLEEEKK